MKMFTSKIRVGDLGNVAKKIRFEAKRGDRSYTDLIDILFEKNYSQGDIIDFVVKDSPSVITSYCVAYVKSLFNFEN